MEFRMNTRFSRRYFLKGSAAAAAATAVGPSILRAADVGSKLNIAVVGAGGQGQGDMRGFLADGDNLVAFAETDPGTRQRVAAANPGAKAFSDFRKMLDEVKEIDAVTVSIPDHMHAQVAARAIALKKHVFVQKPMAHTVDEATLLLELARKHKVVTAMGNQGHAGEGWRTVCEHIWAGNLGEIKEIVCWTNRSPSHWSQGIDRPAGEDPIPAGFDWDLWQGPAPARPFKAAPAQRAPGHTGFEGYHPFAWRGWWDFGSGALGDMGCHILDGPFWALFLGMPNKLEMVAATENNHKETGPRTAILRYYFPAREGTLPNGEKRAFPACTVTWYEGVTAADRQSGRFLPRPEQLEANRQIIESGTFFLGSKANIMVNEYGQSPSYFPLGARPATNPPQMIPRVRMTNYQEFVQACKGGTAPGSNFEYAVPLTRMVQFGNLVLRAGLKPGESFLWDEKTMTSPDRPEVKQFLTKEYRKGWELKDFV
jgi:predicted dehydrogenase